MSRDIVSRLRRKLKGADGLRLEADLSLRRLQPRLDALWERVRARPEGWFLYAVGETPPTAAASGEDCTRFVAELDDLLRREHDEDYCGIVYADDLAEPTLIKVYDPHNLGVSCGFSTNPPLPGWVLSRIRPVDLPAARAQTAGRRRWWQRILGS